MSDYINRQDVLDEFWKCSDHLDKDMIIRTYIGLKRLPSVQSERKLGRWNQVVGNTTEDEQT